MRTSIPLAAAVAALVLAAPTVADSERVRATQLVGTVGPGFSISLADAGGAAVTHLDPGGYSLLVHDASDFHDFHLTGPGVDVRTDVEFVGDRTFELTLADGTYAYICDPHSSTLHGSFTVGTAPPPPPPPPVKPPVAMTIAAHVGPGRTLAFPAKLAAGRYAIAVRDLSAHDNLHLTGRGVNKRTGVAFKGSVRWTVTLRAGAYRVSSDAHRSLARTVLVR